MSGRRSIRPIRSLKRSALALDSAIAYASFAWSRRIDAKLLSIRVNLCPCSRCVSASPSIFASIRRRYRKVRFSGSSTIEQSPNGIYSTATYGFAVFFLNAAPPRSKTPHSLPAP
jgi:hypothetical protein